jgi:integrase
MSIRQLSPDLWFLDVRVYRGRDQLRKREKFAGRRKDAEFRYWTLKKELQEFAKTGNCSLTAKITTFENIIDYYLSRHETDDHSRCYFSRLKKDLGTVRIEDLRDRFDRYMLLLRQTKCSRTGRNLSNQSINHYLKWARAAINLCVRNGLIDKNPLQYFSMLKTMPRTRMLSEEEKERLLATVKAEAPDKYPIVLFALHVPSRYGELVSLKRTDYNMVTNTVHVSAERTKNGRPCIKPVPECLVEYMRNVPPESEYLFYRRDGRGRYHPLGDFHHSFRRLLNRIGIENFRFHDLRRQAYTELLLAGNAPHIVMQVSGHQTDMSRVYFGRNELLAAKSVKFGQNRTLYSTLEGCDTALSSVN